MVAEGLIWRISSSGVAKMIGNLNNMQRKFGAVHDKMKPQVDKLSKGFQKFGAVAGIALLKLIEASPRLRAQFEILNFRINNLVRAFGDELAPVIDFLGDKVKGLTEFFNGLPGPMQKAITVGVATVIVLGLLTIAFIALNAAMSPITLIILGIAIAAGLLYLAWETNFLGIQDIAVKVMESLQPLFDILVGRLSTVATAFQAFLDRLSPIFELLEIIVTASITRIVDQFIFIVETITTVFNIIDALLSGDLAGVMAGIATLIENSIQLIIKSFNLLASTVFEVVEVLGIDINIIPDFFADVIDFFDALPDKFKAFGLGLADAFITGIVDGLLIGVKLVEEALGPISGLFGGSLPERGPLKNIVHMGEEVGETYVTSIGVGLEKGGAGDTFTNIFQIDKIQLEIPEATLDNTTKFMTTLDDGVRQATRF